MKKEIYQFSTINALMSGVFKGSFEIGAIKEKGNFGLGCSDGLTGEIIIRDHVFMEAKAQNPIRLLQDNDRIPFVQITTFCPDNTVDVSDVNKDNLYETLAQHTLLNNVFLAIKIEGLFDHIKVRTPNDKGIAYKDAVEVSKNQIVRDLSAVKGTLVGFWTPKFFDNILVAGFHVHFINEDTQIGGHVIDFALNTGSLAYEVKYNLNIELPNEQSYLEKNLDIDNMSDIIKKVEN